MAAPTLTDGQMMLGGLRFGAGTDPVQLTRSGVDRGEWDVDSQDVMRPGDDGVTFGKDTAKAPVWTFKLKAHEPTARASIDALRQLANLWAQRSTRLTPGADVQLYYREAGQTRYVRGRPRKFAMEPADWDGSTLRRATATFQLSEPMTYSGEDVTIALDLVTTSDASSLPVLPVTLPFRLGQESRIREGFVTVDQASSGVPVRLTIRGPITGAVVSPSLQAIPLSGGHATWKIDLTGVTVRPNETLIVDTGTGLVTRNGAPVVLGPGARSALRARLFYGRTELVYSASDPSLTSTATLTYPVGSPI